MDRPFAALGSLLAFLGVGFGAFAAHGLANRLEPRALEVFEIGARYQMYHALALVALALWLAQRPGPLARWAGWAFVAGVLLFSGSLYLLALTGVGAWGAITPLGGVAFLAGWTLLVLHALRT